MTSLTEIRSTFLDFFQNKGHAVVPSSSLIPYQDATLLFTNAGMNQFKDVFLGHEKQAYSRATSVQKCVRAGGKHNDLENVGYTARHHTFFEMLGNFSFGDYFKKEAIHYGWELLTKVFCLPKDRLIITVYEQDNEAYSIWHDDIGISQDRIIRIGDNKGAPYASDNFWMMGETGPCGPCTEIFYDHGEHIWGGLPGSPEQDGDRFVEIWNIVFMQYNRDANGNLHRLPRPSVDTGMGLERIAAILQGVHSNYEIDVFQKLIACANQEAGCSNPENPSLKVLADHIRAVTFLIADGVIPENEGRGYVLRRIIRRAIRHGYKLGRRTPFFYRMIPMCVEVMNAGYPELKEQTAKISAILEREEQRFFETLEQGMKLLEIEFKNMEVYETIQCHENGGVLEHRSIEEKLDGNVVFKLHDTYGFPFDLTEDICRERGVGVDNKGFDEAMARQKENSKLVSDWQLNERLSYSGQITNFRGYETLCIPANIVKLYVSGEEVSLLQEGTEGIVVLDQTPFYAESGGQVGDSGTLNNNSSVQFDVQDTKKIQADVFGHYGKAVEGELRVGEAIVASVDMERRLAIQRNHSATHLLHKALRDVLGDHVQQKGSLVDHEKTRFDFSHFQAMSAQEIAEVEFQVNCEILNNAEVNAQKMSMADAKKSGAVMLFDEKYGDTVRVLDIGSSRELCGGTHVARVGDIGLFRIINESPVSSGIRRMEGITGHCALTWLRNEEDLLTNISNLVGVGNKELLSRLEQIVEKNKALEKTLERTQLNQALEKVDGLLQRAIPIAGGRAQLLVEQLGKIDSASLRGMVDKLKARLPRGIIILASLDEEKISLIVGVTSELSNKIKAGDLVAHIAKPLGGKGGGRADLAMGSGKGKERLSSVLSDAKEWVSDMILNHK